MTAVDLVLLIAVVLILGGLRMVALLVTVRLQPRERDPQPPRQLDEVTEARRRRAAAWDQPAATFIESRRDDDRRAHLSYIHKRP